MAGFDAMHHHQDMDTDSDSDLQESLSNSETTLSEISSEENTTDDEAALLGSRIWCKVRISGHITPAPPRFPFTSVPSINVKLDSDGDILQYFNTFFDDPLVDMITEQTNLYAEQYQGKSRCNQWHPTTNEEMRIFFAVNILQCVVCKPEQKFFWTKRPILETPFFSKMMSYRRFVLIKKYLHFSDNEAYNPDTHPQPKLNKIWAILSNLNDKFKMVFTPERDITIDESLMLYKGRLGWVQYIPLKRARFGIKTFLLGGRHHPGAGSIHHRRCRQLTTRPFPAFWRPQTTQGFFTQARKAIFTTRRRDNPYGKCRHVREGWDCAYRSGPIFVASSSSLHAAVTWRTFAGIPPCPPRIPCTRGPSEKLEESRLGHGKGNKG
ncbi:hypothetical protein J437_LFUL017302 [Ladona fulva]|uniref:PiggyBac transposable element-derived protein domain-containing protein n=1 Tax=Ladona fulva TaxID=123851 RepID=A0A8K0KFM2_LADFU|nr:hypothetical protein J437_LFUL017302 [Ladona fulva]